MKYITFALYQLSKLILYPYGLIMYPIAYPLRNFIRKHLFMFPLWIVLDDEEDYGEPFFLGGYPGGSIGKKRNFWTSYKWAAIRNNCWNYHSLFEKPVSGPFIFPIKRLKWEYEWVSVSGAHLGWVDGWTVNKGDRLSEKYTTLGWDNREVECIDASGKTVKLWTISYAGKWKWFLINLKLGWNDLGQQIIELKVKLYKKKYTEHWNQPLHEIH